MVALELFRHVRACAVRPRQLFHTLSQASLKPGSVTRIIMVALELFRHVRACAVRPRQLFHTLSQASLKPGSVTRVIMVALELFTHVRACAVRPRQLFHTLSQASLKPGGVAADAAPDISRLTAEMLTAPDDDNDPFASADEDYNELETNELAVEDTD